MKRYSTARSLLQLIAILGWVTVALCLVAVFWSLFAGLGLAAWVTGIGGAFSGLVTVAGVQIAEAILDSAEAGQRTAAGVEELVRAAAQSRVPAPAPVESAPTIAPVRWTGQYRGVELQQLASGWMVYGHVYATRLDAIAAVDERLGPQTAG